MHELYNVVFLSDDRVVGQTKDGMAVEVKWTKCEIKSRDPHISRIEMDHGDRISFIKAGGEHWLNKAFPYYTVKWEVFRQLNLKR